MRVCQMQRAFRGGQLSQANGQSGYSLELLGGHNEDAGRSPSFISHGDVPTDDDGEKQLLSPGGTELYDEGEDGLRVDPTANATINASERQAMLYVVGWASCWQNGIVPAILAFATSPYGPRYAAKLIHR